MKYNLRNTMNIEKHGNIALIQRVAEIDGGEHNGMVQKTLWAGGEFR